jgi:hypothetical protein
MWLLIFFVGIYFFQAGVRAKKKEEKREAGLLSILMATCAFIICILGILAYVLKPTHSWAKLISNIQLLICGVWLGVYIVMHILGHIKLLAKKRDVREDSQNGN